MGTYSSPYAHTHIYATHIHHRGTQTHTPHILSLCSHPYICHSRPSQRNTTSHSSHTLPMLTPIYMPLTSVTEEHNLTLLTYSPYAHTHIYATIYHHYLPPIYHYPSTTTIYHLFT